MRNHFVEKNILKIVQEFGNPTILTAGTVKLRGNSPKGNLFAGTPARLISVMACSLEDAVDAAQIQRWPSRQDPKA